MIAPAPDPRALLALALSEADFAVTCPHRLRDARPGHCAFCARKLSDERSLAAGAGKRCATFHGVAYPSRRP